MLININKNYRITTDKYNYIIEKRLVNEKSGKEYFKSVAFCNNLERCINYVLEEGIREEEIVGVKDIINHLDKAKREILQTLGGQSL